MSSGSEICEMDARDIATAVRAKQLSAGEVIDAVLSRMADLDGIVHAFCTPTPDVAREMARRVDARVRAGDDVGPLAGVPVGVKDLIFTRGIRTMGGSLAYFDLIPEEDDVVVERLSEAGAVILGKTTVPEFGYSGTSINPVSEATRNPWDISRTPGGSSSGSAAAVACGMGPFALGSDGGGSIRIPAAFCGVYGIKASMGRVPLYPGCRDERYPGFSSWESLEHIGPISRTVEDAALVLSVIGGPDRRDRHSLPTADVDWLHAVRGGIRGARVAYSEDWGYARVDREVREIVRSAVAVFETELGCVIEHVDTGWSDVGEAFWALVVGCTDLRGMRRMADELAGGMTPHLAEMLRQEWSVEQLTDAEMTRKAVNRQMWRFMEDFDLLLTPTTAVAPFELGPQGPAGINGYDAAPFEWLPFTAPFNMTGQPAASVPAGWTASGLPVGLQIVGRHLADATVLRASADYERVRPWRGRRVPVLDSVLG